MSWIRWGDELVDEPVFLSQGDGEALTGWTYIRLVSYCAKHLTDGVVPAGALRREDPTAVAALFAGEWIVRREDGTAYLPRFLDRLDDAGHVVLGHHPSRDFVEDRRRARQDAGRKGGQARAVALAKARGKANAKQGLKPEPEPAPSKILPPFPGPSTVDSPVHGSSLVTPPPPATQGNRANGTNPRAVGANPRATGDSPRQAGTSVRQERDAQKRGPSRVGVVMAEALRRAAAPPRRSNGHATGQGTIFADGADE